jgi:hypothetical protein
MDCDRGRGAFGVERHQWDLIGGQRSEEHSKETAQESKKAARLAR